MIDNARLFAFEALDDVIRQGAYSNLSIKKFQNKLNDRDRAFCSTLFYGTLEKLITLDFILSKYLNKNPKPVIKNILRMGVYQIHFMGSVPDHAAVKTSSDIAEKIGKRGAIGFINGVLRNVAREKEDFNIPYNIDKTKQLSIKYSFPEELVQKWTKELGENEAVKLISYKKENNIKIHANSLKDMDNDTLEKRLSNLSIDYKKSDFIEDVYKVGGGIINSTIFENGEVSIQGEASYLGCKVAVENKPKKVLDLCAAPGGKTAAMAHLYPQASYTACDIRQNRIDIMQKQFERLGVKAKLFAMDATIKNSDLGKFDTVLCDVPCSALGTVFEHPEIKYNKTFNQIENIIALQKKIIENAANYVTPNGQLIYSTCTISRQENHDVIEEFLKNNKDFSAVFPNSFHDIINDKRFDGCGVQLFPHVDNTTGFYIACLQRTK